MTEVSKSELNLLAQHIGHKVVMAGYGLHAKPPWVNIAVECEDCGCVIADWEVANDSVH